jgi:hypothetical protein
LVLVLLYWVESSLEVLKVHKHVMYEIEPVPLHKLKFLVAVNFPLIVNCHSQVRSLRIFIIRVEKCSSANPKSFPYTMAFCKVHGLVALLRCYTEGGGDCFAKL